jgi:surface antigen
MHPDKSTIGPPRQRRVRTIARRLRATAIALASGSGVRGDGPRRSRAVAAMLQAGVAATVVIVAFVALGAGASVASADTGGYPYANMPCEHSPYLATGKCFNYDWGPVRNGSEASTYNPATGYGYRNCTDYVAWRLIGLGVPASKLRGLHNGGQWAQYAPGKGFSVSTTPAAGDAAVRVGNPGHVAFVAAVSGPNITVDQYNAAGTGLYSVQTGTPAHLGFQKFVNFGVNMGAGSSPGSGDGSAPGPGTGGGNPQPNVPTVPPPPPTEPTFTETTGGVSNTWSDYGNAGGTQGPSIPANASVQITCAVQGFTVADGNTWWYQVASAPWSNSYYVSADAFYNNGATSGSLLGTPFVDPSVPQCGGAGSPGGGTKPDPTPTPTPTPTPAPAPTFTETTGGVSHTWTNYGDAGGTQGPSIPSNASVQITCAVQGFTVADGNTWWYQIASAPWSNSYYVSADAFYNNGATSGSLRGTPFVDPSVPHC